MNEHEELLPYWCSWFADPKELSRFDAKFPWWSQSQVGKSHMMAAVMAGSPSKAKRIIEESYDGDSSVEIEWGFINVKRKEWSPFSPMNERADWMEWPTYTRKPRAKQLADAILESDVSTKTSISCDLT